MTNTKNRCACGTTSDTEALARTLEFFGLAKGEPRDDASALLYNLREHGWRLIRDKSSTSR
jgi:hypothetical protein